MPTGDEHTGDNREFWESLDELQKEDNWKQLAYSVQDVIGFLESIPDKTLPVTIDGYHDVALLAQVVTYKDQVLLVRWDHKGMF